MTKDTEVTITQQDQSEALMRGAEERFTTPDADIYETPDAYVVSLDMPGAKKDTISITIDRATLIVKGAVQSYRKENAALMYNEISGLGYYRAFNLGEGINQANVDAHFVSGVLTIKMYKKEEAKPREIQIT